MSRIGKLPVAIPQGVKCDIDGAHLKVTGPKGSLEQRFDDSMLLEIADGHIHVRRPSDRKEHRALHGLTRALVQNMVTGVAAGFERKLLINGVGYRASIQGKNLNLVLGFSHPVSIAPPEGIAFEVDGPQAVKVLGIDKQQVGQVSADIRALRKPEPYKGKGIRYENEYIRRKVGKAGA